MSRFGSRFNPRFSTRFESRFTGGGQHAPGEGVGAAAYAPYPAPSGYRWDFVTSLGVIVTSLGIPVIALVVA